MTTVEEKEGVGNAEETDCHSVPTDFPGPFLIKLKEGNKIVYSGNRVPFFVDFFF